MTEQNPMLTKMVQTLKKKIDGWFWILPPSDLTDKQLRTRFYTGFLRFTDPFKKRYLAKYYWDGIYEYFHRKIKERGINMGDKCLYNGELVELDAEDIGSCGLWVWIKYPNNENREVHYEDLERLVA